MNYNRNRIHLLKLVLILLVVSGIENYANATGKLINICPVTVSDGDTAMEDTTGRHSYLDLASYYNSNSNIGGQFSNFVVQPTWSASAAFTFKSGIDASLNYSLIQNSDTTFSKPTSNTNLEIGYSMEMLKYFNLRVSLNHTFQPKNTSSLKKGFDNSVYIGLAYDFEWLNGSFSSNYLLGNKQANQAKVNALSFALANNAFIAIDDFPGEDNSLSFEPGFSLGISDQKLYNNYLLTELTENPKPLIAKLIKKRPLLTAATAIAILKKRAVKGQKLQASSFNINMPIACNIGDFTVKLTPSVYKPLNQPTELVDTSWIFTFEIGIIYSFSL